MNARLTTRARLYIFLPELKSREMQSALTIGACLIKCEYHRAQTNLNIRDSL